MIKKILIILSMVCVVGSAYAKSEEVFFQKLLADTLFVINEQSLSEESKNKKISKIVKRDLAILQVGRAVLGRPWRTLNKAKKREYIIVFRNWVADIIASRLVSFKLKNDLKIVKVFRGANKIVVIRTVARGVTSDSDVTLDWYVRMIKQQPKLIDVSVENISMISAQRAEFSTIYNKYGIDGLIKRLKQQTK